MIVKQNPDLFVGHPRRPCCRSTLGRPESLQEEILLQLEFWRDSSPTNLWKWWHGGKPGLRCNSCNVCAFTGANSAPSSALPCRRQFTQLHKSERPGCPQFFLVLWFALAPPTGPRGFLSTCMTPGQQFCPLPSGKLRKSVCQLFSADRTTSWTSDQQHARCQHEELPTPLTSPQICGLNLLQSQPATPKRNGPTRNLGTFFIRQPRRLKSASNIHSVQ